MRKWVLFAALFLALVLFNSAFSKSNELSGDPNTYSYILRNWMPDKGSPASIYSISQTPDGYLWLANEFGLYRFDGMAFTCYNGSSQKMIRSGDCNNVFLLHDSTLLAGFSDGHILAIKNGKWGALDSASVFFNKNVTAFAEDAENNLWIGLSGKGVMKYSRGASRLYTTEDGLSENNINVILRGSGKEVWVGTDNGLNRFSDAGIQSFTESSGLAHPNINALWLDGRNTLWIGSADGHLYSLSNGHLKYESGLQKFLKSSIKHILGFGSESLVIATEGQGILIYNTLTAGCSKIDTQDGLPSNLILSLYRDNEGSIWAGTMASGLCQIMAAPLRFFTSADGLSGNCITSILQAEDGNVWVGNSNGGIDRIGPARVEKFGPLPGISRNAVYSLAADADGSIWIGTLKNVVNFNGKNARIIGEKEGLKCTYAHALFMGSDRRLFVGTDKGVFIFRNGKLVRKITVSEGLPSNKIFCFLEDREKSIWIGTQDGGIARLRDQSISIFSKDKGLIDNMVCCLYQDSAGIIWAGTGQSGLFFFDSRKEVFNPVLPEKIKGTIGYISPDKHGRIWLAGDGLFISVRLKDLHRWIANQRTAVHLTRLETGRTTGISTLNLGLFPGAASLNNGQKWYPTTQGIVIINPETLFERASRVAPLIDSVRINGRSLPINDSYIMEAGTMKIEIRYTAPGFIDPENMGFRFRLKGFENDWELAGNRRSAYYTNIPPGLYTFEVQASDHFGDWVPQTASIRILIKPFFYETWWFITLMVMALLAMIWLFIKYRIRYIREKELEALVEQRTEEISKLNEHLEQKVRDRTAELEAANKELEAFSYSVSHDLKAPVRRIDHITRAYIEDYFAKLQPNELDLLKKISDAAGSMNILIDELLKLSRIVRQDIDKMQINLSDLASEVNHEIRKLNPGRKVRLQITEGLLDYCDPKLMRILFQNLFDNAWKYSSQVKDACIEFNRIEKAGQRIYFIRDNGAGFDMTYYEKLFTPFQRLHSDEEFTGTGIGLATVKRILLKHGGNIWAESEKGKGTTFFFTLDSVKTSI